jgi:hypothetical protein
MKAAHVTSVFFGVSSESDSEEEVPLVRRPRARSGDAVLAAKDERLKAPSQAALSPQRHAPPVAAAGKPALLAADIPLKTPSPSLLERQRPAPISTAHAPVAEPADAEEWHSALTSPSPLASPASPSSLSSPSRPATPAARTPTAPPADTGPASPIEAMLHPAQAGGVDRLAELFAMDIEELMRINFSRHGQATFREDLNVMHRLFETAKPFMGMEAALLRAQAALKEVLALGDASGISWPRSRQLENLARADISGQFTKLCQLDADLKEARREIINRGGDPNWIRRPAPSRDETEARRQARIDAENAAIRAHQDPFH